MNSLDFYENVSQDIISSKEFINDYENLVSQSYLENFKNIDIDNYQRLIESAAIFSCTNNDLHKKLALKIASSALENNQNNDALKAASELIFMRLGNFPTLEMSFSQQKTSDYFNILNNNGHEFMTPAISAEISGKVSTNRFKIDSSLIFLTDFQSKVFSLLSENKNVSISAPTSTGKSFVLTRFVTYRLLENDNYLVVYLVPSRALISQVQKEFKNVLQEFDITDTQIFTSSYDVEHCEEFDLKKAILVLTQERLQSIEGRAEKLSVDLLIVDEAQKIGEDSRGIILEESVQQVIDWNPDVQKVFISPYSKNPQKFGMIFSFDDINTVLTDLSPVNQNLLFIDINKHKIDIFQGSQELKKKIKITDVQVEEKIPETYRRKAYVTSNIVNKGSTMVYCNGPDDCRKTAKIVTDDRKENHVNSIIDEAIDFLKKNIHPDYYLIDFLKKGVGYHYGHMLPAVRTIVESLFKNKHIDTVCCTSTLLEGVNFPAKNIVIYKPKKGPRNYMDELSFWNLAGRAGRLMKDFSGNIYCIDVEKWKGYKPKFESGKHTIQSSMEEVITKNQNEIINYLYTLARQKDKSVEAAVTRFLINQIRKGNDDFIKQLLERNTEIKKEMLDEINKYVKFKVSQIKLDGKIILKNRSIDPRYQDALYRHLKKMEDPPLPVHPSKDNFYDNLMGIIDIINHVFKSGWYQKYISSLSILSVQWTNEAPLAQIINRKLEYLKSDGKIFDKKGINKIIEDIIEQINKKLKYEICRDISCYVDILEYVMREKGIDTENIDHNLPFYLEIGASRTTTLTLINNGIPRSAAINISKNIPSNIKDFGECERYIRQNYGNIKKSISSILFEELVL